MKRIIFTLLLIILALCKIEESPKENSVLRLNTELQTYVRLPKDMAGFLMASKKTINSRLMQSYDVIDPSDYGNFVGSRYTVCADGVKNQRIHDTLKIVVSKDSAGKYTLVSMAIEDCDY